MLLAVAKINNSFCSIVKGFLQSLLRHLKNHTVMLLLLVIGIPMGWVQAHMNKIIHAQSTHIIDGNDEGLCSVVLL